MPEKYQGESEDNAEARARRLKIKIKGFLPFVKAPANQFPVRRGLKNPNALFRKLQMQLKERGRKKAEDVPYSPEWYKKRAKRSDSMV